MSPPFVHRLRVRYSDCDPQGVVFNANYLTYFDIAITELWRNAFGSYAAMTGDGVDMVVAEANVRYLAPIAFDEEVDLEVEVIRLGTTALTTRLNIHGDGELKATGEMRHVFVDAANGGKLEIPAAIREGLAAYQAAR